MHKGKNSIHIYDISGQLNRICFIQYIDEKHTLRTFVKRLFPSVVVKTYRRLLLFFIFNVVHYGMSKKQKAESCKNIKRTYLDNIV